MADIELIGCSSCGGGSVYNQQDKERLQQQLQDRYSVSDASGYGNYGGNNSLVWIILIIVVLLIIGALFMMRKSNVARRR